MQKILLTLLIILSVARIQAQSWGNYTLVAQQGKTTAVLLANDKTVFKTWTLTGGTGYASYVLPGGVLARSVKATGASFNVPAVTGRFQKVDFNDKMIWDYTYSTTEYCGHHDFHVMPNGNFLIVAYVSKTIADGTAAGMSSGKATFPERIVEVKQTGPTTGEIVWQWDTWDHLVQEVDANKPNYGKVAEHPELLDINYKNNGKDWIHANGIDYNPVLDQIVFSSHYLNEFYVIDHSTTTAEAASHKGGKSGKGGDFIYRWGNPAAYKATGTTNFNVLHDAHWIPNDCPDAGFIVAFNNDSGNSKVDKMKPAFDGTTYDFKANTYLPATNSGRLTCTGFSSNMGSSQQLPNGNQLICIATAGLIYEVDPTGKTIWSHQAGGTTAQASRYSACYVTGTVPKPTVTQNGATLTAATADKYQWYFNGVAIAGATNQTHTATQIGKYQVQTANTSDCKSVFSDIVFVGTTSAVDLENDSHLLVFPNPTSGELQLQGDIFDANQMISIQLFDAQGKNVLSTQNVNAINISAFPKNIYFLKVSNEQQTFVRKIILE
jgi:hypothetical protein